MPQTPHSHYLRTANGRRLAGRVHDYRRKPYLTNLPNAVALSVTSGTVDGTTPAPQSVGFSVASGAQATTLSGFGINGSGYSWSSQNILGGIAVVAGQATNLATPVATGGDLVDIYPQGLTNASLSGSPFVPLSGNSFNYTLGDRYDAAFVASDALGRTVTDTIEVALSRLRLTLGTATGAVIPKNGVVSVGNVTGTTAFSSTMKNVGANTLTFNPAILVPTNASGTSVTSEITGSLTTSGTDAFTLSIVPTATGAFTVGVTLNSSDEYDPTFSFTISGTRTA